MQQTSLFSVIYCLGSHSRAVFVSLGALHDGLHGLLLRCLCYGLCCSYPLALYIVPEPSPCLEALLVAADAGAW